MKNKTVFKIISAFFATLLCFILIIDAEGTVTAARKSVNTCLSVIIPSLFAFMIFSQILIKSNIGDYLFYPLYKLNSFWYKGDRKEFSVFMLSLMGGYPVGVKLIKDLIAYNKNYYEIASSILCYCYCGSPAFIIQIVGLSVLGNSKAGLLVYFSNVLSCLTLAIIMNLKRKRNQVCFNKPESKKIKITLNDLTDSIKDTVKALGTICGTIVAFNIFLEILNYTGFIEILGKIGIDKAFLSFWEISNLSVYNGNNFNLIPLFAAAASFGGLCIIVQISALINGKIPMKKFLLSRIPAAVLSAVYAYALALLFPVSTQVFLPIDAVSSYSIIDPISTVCLIIMTYILLSESKTGSDNKSNSH